MKRRLIIIGLLVGVIGVIGVIRGAGRREEIQIVTPVTEKIKGKIDFGEGEIIEESVEATSAYDVLTEIARKEELELETQQYDFGVFVKSVDKRANTKEKAWIYYVNGQSGDVAADKKAVRGGDTVEWRYTEPLY